MRFTVATAVLSTALLAGSVHADAQSVLSDASSSASSLATEASSSASSLVESVTSAPELPTFTVSTPLLDIQLVFVLTANFPSAYYNQGRFHRAIRRWLGRSVEAISRKEGHEECREPGRRVGVRWRMGC
jgi:hypothetical protein